MSILGRVQVNTAKQKMLHGRPAYGYGISLVIRKLLDQGALGIVVPMVIRRSWPELPLTRAASRRQAPAHGALVKRACTAPIISSQDDRHGRALEKILEACRNAGKAPGLACASPEDARRPADQGWQCLTAGSDAAFIPSAAGAGLALFAR